MVVRAGYGIAFDPLNTFQVTSVAAAVPGQSFRCSSQFSGSGGALVTTPGCQAVPNVRLGAAFPNEMAAPTAKPSSFLTPPAQVTSNAPPARVFDQNLKLPTVHMWNVTVQHELPGGYVVSAGYVGRRGTRLYRAWDMNQIDVKPILPSFLAMQRNVALGGGCRADGTLANGSPCPGASPVPIIQQGIINSAFANTAATSTDLSQNAAGNFGNRIEQSTLAAHLRPNQQFAQIMLIDNGGDSYYHAGQLTVRKRFDNAGLIVNGAYTFGKSIDTLSLDPVASTVGGGLTTTNARTAGRCSQLPERTRPLRFRPAPRRQHDRHLRTPVRQGQAAARQPEPLRRPAGRRLEHQRNLHLSVRRAVHRSLRRADAQRQRAVARRAQARSGTAQSADSGKGRRHRASFLPER